MNNLTLDPMFSDGMVLQREKPIPVWGSGPAGELVTVTLAGKSASAIVWEDGTWKTSLPAAPADGPLTLTVSCGAQTLRREQVYLGEVWLAGGQSNMELALKDSRDGEQAVQNSGNPYLHYYQPPKAAVIQEAECAGWQTVTPETAGDLSAVAFYAAKTLSEHLLGIHIGVLVCCWGGTYAHCWMPREDLAKFPAGQRRLDWYETRIDGKTDEEFDREFADYQGQVDDWNRRAEAYRKANPLSSWTAINRDCGRYPWPPPAGQTSFQRPGNLYASMLRRLCPYALRGFWYYQGEQDEEWPEDYFDLLNALIHRWRKDWRDETLPFLLMQLPMYGGQSETVSPMSWPLLRKAQSDAADRIPGVELAALTDCGEIDNIHPSDEYALEHEGQLGKTEMWVVLEAEPDGFIYYGFERPVTREEFARRIEDGTLTEVLHKAPAKAGDVFFIPSGTLHAIGKGLVIAEIQQNSNVTYRVFDYNRLGPDGNPRPLHVEKALEVTNLCPVEQMDFGPHLGKCPYFTVDRNRGSFQSVCGEDSFHALLISEGTAKAACGTETLEVKKGDCLFLPAGSGAYWVEGDCETLTAYIS